ncbi:auxilin-like protein 1 isoform X2 [Macadamia integrifolia]|uniref:auxilin-like protein 1 isoform X2 n=1 Tax=Macadamia integrifolia TaxID=60698 RepID=UPI001C4F6D32|nr:auxilin-like protein 1 isoform X2 [Macadamia integrifolia]
MEDYSHAFHRNQASATVSKKISHGNGFPPKTVYDDVFGGPPKFGVPTFSSRIEDYTEIFGSFRSSRGSSIPVLDLPVPDSDDVSVDFRAFKFDYSEVFGGLNGDDFFDSHEELFGESKGGESSSEEAWTPAGRGSPSEGSSVDTLAYSEKNHFLSDRVADHKFGGVKQFDVSNHETAQRSEEDGTNGTTHSAQHQAVPGVMFVVDGSTLPQKTEVVNTSPLGVNDVGGNMDSNGGTMEAKNLKKTTSLPPMYSSITRSSGNDFKLQNRSQGNGSNSNDMFVSVSEISLRTQPSQVPPPMRPPPKLLIKQGNSKIASEKYGLEGATGDNSPPFFDVEVDASSSAAASAAAMKEAMDKAQARLKSAKESMERKREGLQSRLKLGLKDELNGRARKEDIKATHETFRFRGDVSQETSERENVGMNGFGRQEGQHDTRTAQVAPDFEGKEKQLNVGKEFVEPKVMKKPISAQESHIHKEAVEWKVEKQFYELAKTGKLKATPEVLEQAKIEKKLMSPTITQKHEESEMVAKQVFEEGEENVKISKASKEACEQGNVRKLETAKEAHEVKKKEKKLKVVAQEMSQNEENEKKLKLAQEISKHEKDEKKLKVACALEGHGKKLEEAHEQKENEKKLKEACEWEEIEKRQREASWREVSEGRLKDADVQEENGEKLKESCNIEENAAAAAKEGELKKPEKKLKAAQEMRENEENEKKLKLAQENSKHEEDEKKLKVVCTLEGHGMKLEEAHEQKENEEKLKVACEWKETEKRRREASRREVSEGRFKNADVQEENGKKIKESCNIEEKEKRLKDSSEQEESEKKLKEACDGRRLQAVHEKEENDKRQKEVCEGEENEKRLKEACEKEENENRIQEAHEREENEKRLKQAFEREENERRLKEAHKQKESEDRLKEVCKMVENKTQLKEVFELVENQGERKANEEEKYENGQKQSCEGEENENKVKADQEAHDLKVDKILMTASTSCGPVNINNSEANQEGLKHEENNGKLKLAREAIEHEGRGRMIEAAKEVCESEGSGKELTIARARNGEHESGRSRPANVAQCAPEQDRCEQIKVSMECLSLDELENKLGESEIGIDLEQNEKNNRTLPVACDQESLGKSQVAFDQEGYKEKNEAAQGVKNWVENEKKTGLARPAMCFEEKGNMPKVAQQVSKGQNTERKERNYHEISSNVEREKEARLQREREQEEARLRKIEEEKDREREREKDRMAVERATREARERAFAEARERAERAAVERATAEARQRAMAEAREKLEKASAEAREKSLAEKAFMEVRLRAERAAVERATAEARERAAGKAALEARERAERSVADRFSTTNSRDSGMRRSSSLYEFRDPHLQSSGSDGSLRRTNSSVHGASCTSVKFQGTEGESAQRCKARLERHQRTFERAAKALAEKNMRDLLAQREQAERNRLAETLDAEVRRWSSGKEGNLRALLSTLQYVLGPDSGWQPIPLTEVITAVAVKKAYRKATLCVHPDKLQQRGASIQQKYICEKVFDLLKEAWNKFNSEER